MKDNEIIEVEKVIKDLHGYCFCSQPIFKKIGYNFTVTDFECLHNLICLIKHQKAEIERLKQENKKYCEDNHIIVYQRNQRDKEIRALHNQLNGLNFMDKQIKSEAIKEFADRLKNEMRLEDDCQYDCMGCLYACKEYVPMIDNLVKEMTEVSKNE